MSNSNIIKPRLPGGFRDLLPDEFSKRQWILDKASDIYESFGFKPLETSSVEHFGTLAGGDETSKQIYKLFNQQPDHTADSLALRFDLTVSLARVLAANRSKFNLPFKRYQIGYVWRGERQQKGRFKQFLQFDADIVGAVNPMADAEIVVIIDSLMKSLGLNNYTIRLNHRRILNGFILSLGLNKDDVNLFLRILDKIDTIGWEGVVKKLAVKPDEKSELSDDALGLSPAQIGRVQKFMQIPRNCEQALSELYQQFEGDAEIGPGIDDLARIIELTAASGVSDSNLIIDTSLARGLDYYTGPVFETILDDIPEIGSVMSGGRYDNLMRRFGNESFPATGISLGVDRLMVGLEELGLMGAKCPLSKVLLIALDSAAENVCFGLAAQLRSEGIDTEVYLGDNRKLKKQLTYANQRQIPFAVIIGTEEIETGRCRVKNLTNGEQNECSLDGIVEYIRSRY